MASGVYISHRCPKGCFEEQNGRALHPFICPNCGSPLDHEAIEEPAIPPPKRTKCLGCISFAVIHEGVVQEAFQLRLRIAELERELAQAQTDLEKMKRTVSPLHRPQPPMRRT